MTSFLAFDHIDCRVRSLRAVEPFYDRFMIEIGLPEKKRSFVDSNGDWHDAAPDGSTNVVEYYEAARSGAAPFFIGFIEDPQMVATATRIAFRLASTDELARIGRLLDEIGARKIEHSASPEYPAIFFEDPAGTRLEVCARPPRD